jgi:protein SCO1/2
MRSPALLLTLCLAAGLSACGGAKSDAAHKAEIDPSCVARLPPEQTRHFSLVSHEGKAITEADFKGSKTLVFFGFATCRDICPITMVRVRKMIEALPKGEPIPKTLFVSVDPERDTPDQLAIYAASNGFPPNLTTATGKPADLEAMTKSLGTAFSREEDPDSAAGYVMAHSSLLYLMDENWNLKTYFWPEMPPDAMARCIAAID